MTLHAALADALHRTEVGCPTHNGSTDCGFTHDHEAAAILRHLAADPRAMRAFGFALHATVCGGRLHITSPCAQGHAAAILAALVAIPAVA